MSQQNHVNSDSDDAAKSALEAMFPGATITTPITVGTGCGDPDCPRCTIARYKQERSQDPNLTEVEADFLYGIDRITDDMGNAIDGLSFKQEVYAMYEQALRAMGYANWAEIVRIMAEAAEKLNAFAKDLKARNETSRTKTNPVRPSDCPIESQEK